MKIGIGPKISPHAANLLETVFKSRNAGAEYVLESFRGLYRSSLIRLKGYFTSEELFLMIHIVKNLDLRPTQAGRQLSANIRDSMTLDGIDKQFNVIADVLNKKCTALTLFERSVLEIWLSAWVVKKDNQPQDDYIKLLARDLSK